MIFDTLEHLGRYRGLDPRLDRGLEALGRLTAQPPPADGRRELEGEELYASLSTYRTGAEKPFEAHRRYLDIQAVLAGRETLRWAPLDRLAPRGEYSPGDDVAFYEEPPDGAIGLPLGPGSFVVLFPQDAHQPGCRPAAGGGEAVRKLVIKVRV